MKYKPLPSQKLLHQVLDYNSDTGIFVWKSRGDVPAQWNGQWAGKIAGRVASNGYNEIAIKHTRYRAHRLAWVYVYGDMADERIEIDHKNRIKNDNRIDNLRLATKSSNSANSVGKSRSGLPKGVEKNKKRFSARLMINRKRFNLGTYDTPEEAQKIYFEALIKYHGEFARVA